MSRKLKRELEASAPAAESSTVVVISSDGHRVGVNGYRLTAQSKVFEDMLATCNDCSNEVHAAESNAVLELVLPYCAQARVGAFALEGELAWAAVKAFDKYDIGRGMDAVAGAIELARKDSMTSKVLVMTYFIRFYFDREELDSAVRDIIDFGRLAEFEAAFATFVEEERVSDGGKLISLLTRRKLMLATKRSSELIKKMASNFGAQRSGFALYSDMQTLLNLWAKSSTCTTVEHLDQFLVNNAGKWGAGSHLLPWAKLRETIAGLPTALE